MKPMNWVVWAVAFVSGSAMASEQGTLTRIAGEVRWMTPSDRVPETFGALLKWENRTYRYRSAAAGDRISDGDVIQASSTGRAFLVFDNGDQVTVAPSTHFRVSGPKGDEWDLRWGKIRGVIQKRPKERPLQIRTRSAVMGVRGTEFFVLDRVTEGTDYTVIRGEVEVRPKTSGVKPASVGPGQVVTVAAGGRKVSPARKLSRMEIGLIEKLTVIAPESGQSGLSEERRKRIEAQEKKARETLVADIRSYSPGISAEGEFDSVQSQGLKSLLEGAPEKPDQTKPYLLDLLQGTDDAYDKYFNQ